MLPARRSAKHFHFGATANIENNSYSLVHVDTQQLNENSVQSAPLPQKTSPTQTATAPPNPTQPNRAQAYLSDAMQPNPHRTQTEITRPTRFHGPPQLSSTRDDTPSLSKGQRAQSTSAPSSSCAMHRIDPTHTNLTRPDAFPTL